MSDIIFHSPTSHTYKLSLKDFVGRKYPTALWSRTRNERTTSASPQDRSLLIAHVVEIFHILINPHICITQESTLELDGYVSLNAHTVSY